MKKIPSVSTKKFDEYDNLEHKIFCGAESFAEAAAISFPYSQIYFGSRGAYFISDEEKYFKAVADEEIWMGYYGVAFTCAVFVNQTLALELYFKCLLTIEKIVWPKKHNLVLLYRLIPERSKHQIQDYYKIEIKKHEKMRAEFKVQVGKTIETDFETLLEKSCESFVDLRYLFEHKSDKFDYNLSNIMIATKEYILKLRPQWPFLDINTTEKQILKGK